MKRASLFFIVLIFIFASGDIHADFAADFNPNCFKWLKKISIAEPFAGSNAVAVPVDADVFAGARQDLADIRIVDAQGKVIPYKLSKLEIESEVKSYGVKIISQEKDSASSQKIILDLGSEVITNRVALDIADSDFIRAASIEAGKDTKSFAVVHQHMIIAGISVQPGLKFAQLRYPRTTARYLRVALFVDEGEEPLKIQGASVKFDPIDGQEFDAVSADSDVQDEGEKSTQQKIKLKFKGLQPISTIRFSASSSNFIRRVAIYDPSSKEIANDLIARIKRDDGSLEKLDVFFKEISVPSLSIVIENGDMDKLVDPAAFAYRIPRRLIFLSNKVLSGLELYYGCETAGPIAFDFQKLYQQLSGESRPPLLSVSTPIDNPKYAEAHDVSIIKRFSWAMKIGIGICIAAFMAMIWLIIKDMRKKRAATNR